MPWKCQGSRRGRAKGPAQSLATLKAHDASFECCISRTLLIKRRPPQFPPSHLATPLPASLAASVPTPLPAPLPPLALCVAAQCIVCALKVTPKLTPAPTSTTLRLFIGFSCCGYCCSSPLLLFCFFFFLLNCQLSELLLLLLLWSERASVLTVLLSI